MSYATEVAVFDAGFFKRALADWVYVKAEEAVGACVCIEGGVYVGDRRNHSTLKSPFLTDVSRWGQKTSNFIPCP